MKLKNIDTNNMSEDQIKHEVKKIHSTMKKVFEVDFPFFKDIKIISKSKAREIINEKILLRLKEKGVTYPDHLGMPIEDGPSSKRTINLLENMAFYDEKEDTLYLVENLLHNHPERILTTCAHELSEKLISTYVPQLFATKPTENLLEIYMKNKNSRKRGDIRELIDGYRKVAFRSILKEGSCEAIALKTLLHTNMRSIIRSADEELREGHQKTISILHELEGRAKQIENAQIAHILESSIVIKSVSYYLGYPLASAILDEYGIQGVFATLKAPPLKAEYYARPSSYMSFLEKKENGEEVKK